jgi:hypothetical protein
MIECPGWAAKKVNSQAQRGRMSKEVRAMDRWEQSPTYAASQDPQEVERSPFWGQRSRSRNRSLVRRGKGRDGEECKGAPAEAQNRQSLAQEPKKSLKRRCPRVGVRWKGRRKQHPKAPFSAAIGYLPSCG